MIPWNDCVAKRNDGSCGARPLFFRLYSHRKPSEKVEGVKGVTDDTIRQDVPDRRRDRWMPGFYREDEVDLAGLWLEWWKGIVS